MYRGPHPYRFLDKRGLNKTNMAVQNEKLRLKLLTEFENRLKDFHDLKSICEQLVKQLLDEEKIKVHTVSGRVKEKDKLAEKLSKPEKNYSNLREITDVVGIRIITHFEDEIYKIGDLITKEFTVDPANSVDKGKMLDPDRFGYLSLHYICSLSDHRLKLREYMRFRDIAFEIQIRSILQHAWAEIEHDLGYKSGTGVPDPIRRRFSRLAGLLEVADQEFGAIRDWLHNYAATVKTEVTTSPEEVGIDNISLKAIFEQNSVVHEIDEEIAKGSNAKLKEYAARFIPLLSRGLPLVGINTVGHLIAELIRQRDLLVYQAIARFKDKGLEDLDRGVSVLQLLWVLLWFQGGEEGILKGLAKMGLEGSQPNHAFAHEMSQQINEFQKKAGLPKIS